MNNDLAPTMAEPALGSECSVMVKQITIRET